MFRMVQGPSPWVPPGTDRMELSMSPADSFWTEHDREVNLQSEPRRWWVTCHRAQSTILTHTPSRAGPPVVAGKRVLCLRWPEHREPAGRRWARGSPDHVRSHVKEAGRWGQWGSAPGSEQENARDRTSLPGGFL